ncbi:MAG: hypothetical protein ACFFDC_20640, partial [Promethearchaeota archaeon]
MLAKTKILVKLLKSQLNSLILIILSLSFPLVLIVAIGFLLDSNSETLFVITKQKFQEDQLTHLSIRIPYQQDLLALSLDHIDQITHNVTNVLTQGGIEDFFIGPWITPNIKLLLNDHPWNILYFEKEKTTEIRNLLLPGGQMPQKESEIIISVPAPLTGEYQTNATYSFDFRSPHGGKYIATDYNLMVVGILPIRQASSFTKYVEYLEYLSTINQITGLIIDGPESAHYNVIVPKETISTTVANLVLATDLETEWLNTTGIVYLNYRINTSALTTSKISLFMDGLLWAQDAITQQYPESIIIRGQIDYCIGLYFREWYLKFQALISLSFPLIIISLLFINFVVNNLIIFRVKQTWTLRLRGVSRNYLVTLTLVEWLVSILLSIIVAILLGIGLTLFLVGFTGATPIFTFNPAKWLGIVGALAAGTSALAYWKVIQQIFRVYSQQKTFHLSKDEEEEQVHFWAVKLFIVGAILFLFSLSFLEYFDLQYLPLPITTYQTLLVLGLFVALIFMFIGVMFSLKTIFFRSFQLISRRKWLRRFRLPFLAVRNIKRFSRSFSQIWLFVTILLSYSFVLSIFSASTINSYHDQAKFTIGADYHINLQEADEQALLQYITTNMSKLSNFAKVTLASLPFKVEVVENVGPEPIRTIKNLVLVGIHPSTYFKTAYFHPQFKLSSSLSTVNQAMQNDNRSVCVNKYFLDNQDLIIGDSYMLNLVNTTNSSDNYAMIPIEQLTVLASFESYPLVSPSSFSDSMIVHQDLIDKLLNFPESNSSVTTTEVLLLRTT